MCVLITKSVILGQFMFSEAPPIRTVVFVVLFTEVIPYMLLCFIPMAYYSDFRAGELMDSLGE